MTTYGRANSPAAKDIRARYLQQLERRADAETLRTMMRALRDRSYGFGLWITDSVALEISLMPGDIDAAFDPGAAEERALWLPPWRVYAALLRLLGADDAVQQECETHHAILRSKWGPVRVPPADIACIATEQQFRDALATLFAATELTLSQTHTLLRAEDRDHAWGRSAIWGYTNGKGNLPPRSKKKHLRNLLTVLCDHADRPVQDVEHFLVAWARLLPHQQFNGTGFPGGTSQRQPAPPIQSEASPSAPRTVRLSTLLTAVVISVTITVVVLLCL
jgi:hypothetical protein